MEPLVSVIVPVYNKINFLNQCIESLVNQSIKNIEILLIDDGSTDGSSILCDEWQKKDSRIQVIHKNNEGLGPTRNLGLAMASGKYISFVDADDYLILNSFEICARKIEEEQAEVCYFGRNLISDGRKLSHAVKIDDMKRYEKEEISTEFVKFFLGDGIAEGTKRHYVTASACCSFYKKSFLKDNKILFFRIKYSEDVFFNLEICKYASRIIVIPDMLYCQNIVRDSLSRNYEQDRFAVYLELYHMMQKYIPIFYKVEDVTKRVDKKFIMYITKSIRQIAENESFFKGINLIRPMCCHMEVKRAIREILNPKDYKKNSILLRFILYRQCTLIMIYYRIKRFK